MTRTGKVLLSGLLFAAAGAFTAQAAESDAAVYRPTQGLNHRFGSKLAVGYFLQKDGACALSIFLTENATRARLRRPRRACKNEVVAWGGRQTEFGGRQIA